VTAAVSPSIFIHRVPHNTENPYLCVNQETVLDARLSLAARGLLMVLLSNKDSWHIEPYYLAQTLHINVATVRKLLKELSTYHYIKLREKINGAHGQITWTDYQVYERPYEDDSTSEDTSPASSKEKTVCESTSDGSAMHGNAQPIINIKSAKKENDSPYGDAHADEASQSKSPSRTEKAVRTSVCTSEPANAKKDVPTQSGLVKASEPSDVTISDIENSSLPGSVSRAAKPVIDVSRQVSRPITHSHSPSAMQAAVAHALKIERGAYAGKIGQFFAGQIPRTRKHNAWAQFQPETPAAPQEIIALLLWYAKHPAYATSCLEHGGKLPSTPAILRDRLDEFRESPEHANALAAAAPLLERLIRGESVSVSSPPKPMTAGPIEAVEAYTPYSLHQDQGYHHAIDQGTARAFDRLFGER
jgi:hypothetical protein